MKETRDRIIDTLTKVGVDYLKEGRISGLELYSGRDVHAFYRIAENENLVVHVKAYPRMTREDGIGQLMARTILYGKMLLVRSSESVSIGNEHDAVVDGTQDMFNDVNVFDPDEIKKKLKRQKL